MVHKAKIKQEQQTKDRPVEVTQYDEPSEDLPMYDEGKKGGTVFDRIVLNNKLRVSLAMFLAAVVMPILVYAYVFDVDEKVDPNKLLGACILHPEYRVPCLVGRSNITYEICSGVGCCWNETTIECHHSIPTNYNYVMTELPTSDTLIHLGSRTETTPFLTSSIQELKCSIRPITDNHLQILIKNELDDTEIYNTGLNINDTSFDVLIYNKTTFSLEIQRRVADNDSKNATLLLSTSRGPLIASENYWEVTFQLSKDSIVYGLGGLRLTTNVANPTTLYTNSNNTGAHPILMAMDQYGQAHGIYLQHIGPIEIHFIKDSNLLILRALSSEGFHIHIFSGPTPKEVLSQLTDVLGRPKMPPYWAMGLHICRDDDGGKLGITDMMNEYNEFREAALVMGLPYDTHCLNDKLLKDLTFNITAEEDLESVIAALELLETDGKKFIMTLPSPLAVASSDAYLSAVEQNVLVQQSSVNMSHYVGEYDGKNVVYPDWTHPESSGWLQAQIKAFMERLELSHIDGVVLPDNWPSNQREHNMTEDLVYIPQNFNGSLSNGTLWWKSGHENNITHSEVHNIYGLLHSEQVSGALNANATLILSSSTYPGSGRYGGTHEQANTQVPAKWSSLKNTLLSVLGLGLAGIPLASGGSVCGSMSDFNHTLHEALCLKWYLLSITLPLIRVSSVSPYRDPTSLSSGFTRKAVLQALKLRYTLLPYYYTTFEEASTTGSPVARPMFVEFPDDNLTRYADEQFMVGSALLVVPVLVPQAIDVNVYLPKENTTWYQLIGGHPINNGTGGRIIAVSTLETETTILLRGGFIVPIQKPGLTTESSRLNPYHLLIGLNCSLDIDCNAKGHLYLDSDDASNTHIYFTANQTSFTVTNIQNAQFLCSQSGNGTVIDEVSVYGLNATPINSNWIVNKKNLNIDWCGIDDDSITEQYEKQQI